MTAEIPSDLKNAIDFMNPQDLQEIKSIFQKALVDFPDKTTYYQSVVDYIENRLQNYST